MNNYSLVFHNAILEEKYIQYYNRQQIVHINTILKLNYPQLIYLSLVCYFMGSYIPCALAISSLFSSFFFQRALTRLGDQKVIWLYELFLLTNPEMMFIAIYFSNNSQAIGINFIVWLMVDITLIVTPNILLATIQYFNNFVVLFVIIYIIFGFTPYIFVWIPLFIFCMYQYYVQKKNQKLLFQQSQVNQSRCKQDIHKDTLIKETAVDDIMYFQLNRELLRYELEFTNIDNLNLNSFLSSIVIDRKQNIQQYLSSKVNENNLASYKHRIIGYRNLKEKVELEIYIQYYPDLRFYIRIIKQDHIQKYPKQESKIMYNYYKKITTKAQLQPQSINLLYVIRYLCSLNARIQLQRIVRTPNDFLLQVSQFNVLAILQQQYKNLQIQFEAKYDAQMLFCVNSNQKIFEILIYYLLKLIKQTNNGLCVSLNNNGQWINVLFSFQNPRKVNSGSLLNKLGFLQSLLSRDELIIQQKEVICFVDLHKGIPFR